MSQFSTSSYEVPRTTGVCAATGRTLEPGETYYATLADVPEARQNPETVPASEAGGAGDGPAKNDKARSGAAFGLQRADISEAAWNEGFRPQHLFSYWKSTVPEPNEKKKLFVDDAVLMNLLRRLDDTQQPDRLAFRYVLALILMRKKLLRYDGSTTRVTKRDGEQIEQTWWLLTPKVNVAKGPMGKWNEAETLEVLDPHLDEAAMERVTQQLGEILEAEL